VVYRNLSSISKHKNKADDVENIVIADYDCNTKSWSYGFLIRFAIHI
jgi:hypothetical protein